MPKPWFYIWIYLKGFAMGVADLVPGISGGTVALITGIYSQLIHSLANIHIKHFFAIILFLPTSAHQKWRKKNRKIIQEINWSFLLPLIFGILSAVFSMSVLISFILKNYESFLYAFFLGVVVCSIQIPWKKTNQSTSELIILIVFAVLVFLATNLTEQIFTQTSPIILFISGAVAICAMILPGISGAYLLLMLGQYSTILQAVKDLNLNILIWFLFGIIFGAFSFIKLLQKLLKNYSSSTMAALTGSMIGSAYKLWPEAKSNLDWMILFFFFILGVGTIFFLEWVSKKAEK